MTNEAIAKFVEGTNKVKDQVKISFKKRGTVVGQFVQSKDYNELKAKNFWRIVVEPHIDAWKKSNDINLAKIFNGMEITKLTVVKAS
jgi:hypothetical protein